MKKLIPLSFFLLPCFAQAQLGLKAGANFANITNASSINSSSRSGFHLGAFISPKSRGLFGSRTELIFSRQGYNYKTSTNTGNVNLDYIMLPQYLAINITKLVQIQVGGQMAILVSAKADSSNNTGGSNPYGAIIDYYNRFDYGYGGGIEIHPAKGLLVGARVNISLSNLNKGISSPTPGSTPSFIPKVDVKNNLFQVFAGWRFGK